MRISAAFPSDFLKAADLQDRTVKVVIDHVEMREVGGEPKPVLFFRGKERGLVLNKTNAGNISAMFGDETDAWEGGEIALYPTLVDFQGRTVEAIRVRVSPQPPRREPRQEAPPPAEPPMHDDEPVDEIPF